MVKTFRDKTSMESAETARWATQPEGSQQRVGNRIALKEGRYCKINCESAEAARWAAQPEGSQRRVGKAKLKKSLCLKGRRYCGGTGAEHCTPPRKSPAYLWRRRGDRSPGSRRSRGVMPRACKEINFQNLCLFGQVPVVKIFPKNRRSARSNRAEECSSAALSAKLTRVAEGCGPASSRAAFQQATRSACGS